MAIVKNLIIKSSHSTSSASYTGNDIKSKESRTYLFHWFHGQSYLFISNRIHVIHSTMINVLHANQSSLSYIMYLLQIFYQKLRERGQDYMFQGVLNMPVQPVLCWSLIINFNDHPFTYSGIHLHPQLDQTQQTASVSTQFPQTGISNPEEPKINK